MNILVLNSGSSSLKFQLINSEDEVVLHKGGVDGIGLDTCEVKFDSEKDSIKISDHSQAIKFILDKIPKDEIGAVGHRVVHGGSYFNKPTLITDDVIKKIDELKSIAPLHNPANLAGINACKELLPGLSQVAVFDTAFHQTLPKHAFMYSLPVEFYEKYGVRKYGFHGTSHKFIMQESRKTLNKDSVNIISAHVGNGTSICAIRDNKSIETSMGFTPLEGVLMGTRAGDLDPGVPLYIAHKEGLSLDDVDRLLNKESGLKGLTGSSDMRIIEKRALDGDEYAILAREMLAYRIVKYIGAYYAIVGKIDALVFTAGLGENDSILRTHVCSYLSHLGFELDELKNARHERIISKDSSKIKIMVIPTNEELTIARDVRAVLEK